MKHGFEAANIVVKNKLTHVPRRSGAAMASLAGVPEDEIRRQGRWNQDVMTNCYVDTLPRQFLRVMAGFEKDSLYHLPRAIEVPCQELQDLVFPMVDTWLARIQEGQVLQTSGSASHFLALLKCFKVALLQDAAVMMDRHPDLPIWQDDVFLTQDFLDFKSRVNAHVAADIVPQSALLSELASEVEQQMVAMRSGFDDLVIR